MKTSSNFIVTTLLLLSFAVVVGGGSTALNRKTNSALEVIFVRTSLKNVDDLAGRYQYAGGKVYENGKHIAQFASTKRIVTGGTDVQNTAMLTVTIFFLGQKPPENITLQGSHDFDSGIEIGSVSAASKQYSYLIGKTFRMTNETLVIEE